MSNNPIQQREQSLTTQFGNFLERLKPQLALALPKHLSSDRMARLALTQFSTNKDLQQCSTNSIAASIMTAAQLGLEPGVNGQGYLIPYKGTCTFVPGWKGLVDLVARSGRATVWTGVVRDGDEFDYQLGDSPFCKHKPGDSDEDAPFTHVYAIGRVRDAALPVIEVWSIAKVIKHLNKYNKVGGKHYALKDDNNFEMYARKIALMQVLKYMPSSIELSNAIAASHAAEEGRGVTIENGIVLETGEALPTDDAPHANGTQDGKKELPECTPEQFAELAAEWEFIVRSGKKKASVALSAMRTKYILTEQQEFQVSAWETEGK